MLALVGRDGTIAYASAALGRLLGRRPAELAGESLLAYAGEPDAARQRIRASLGRQGDGRLTLTGVDQERFEVTCRRLDGDEHRPLAVVEPADLELPGGELPLEMLDRITDGIVCYDRGWRFRYLNRAAEAYFGAPRTELLGEVVWERGSGSPPASGPRSTSPTGARSRRASPSSSRSPRRSSRAAGSRFARTPRSAVSSPTSAA